MSTSLRSGHVDRHLVFVKAALILAALVASHYVWARDSITLDQRKKLQLAAVDAVTHSNTMPNASPVISVEGNSAWLVISGQKKLIVPMMVRFQNTNNKYCLVASANVDLTSLQFLPLPPQALHDSCFRLYPYYMFKQHTDDDKTIVHGVSLKSNRDGVSVVEVIVYLPDPKSELGFCYSADASAQLTPADLKSKAVLKLALDRTRRRLGLKNFSCSV